MQGCWEDGEEPRGCAGSLGEEPASSPTSISRPPKASQPEVQAGGGSYLCRPLSMKHTSPQLLSPSSGSISVHTAASMVAATRSGC